MDERHSRLRIVVAPPGSPPFLADALVAEEDTYLVLSPDYEATQTLEPPQKLLERATAAGSRSPGTVVVRKGIPTRILAIVHDLNEEPSWREDWVARALGEMLREAEERRFESIALPMLGTLYGSLDEGRFVELLRAALREAPLTHLRDIWLMVHPGVSRALFAGLDDFDVDLGALEGIC
jgi:hypothetical protein